MIVVGLMGGVGNQLFQYCTGRRLAVRLGTELCLDPSFLNRQDVPQLTQRPYLLDRFTIAGSLIGTKELDRFLMDGMPRWRSTANRISSSVFGRTPFPNPRVFIEKDRNFEPRVLDLPDERYLRGYFQSPLYFQDVREVLLKDLSVKSPLDGPNNDMLKRIQECDSVCVHVRRGDYYSNPSARKVHAVDLSDYYRKAVSLMRERQDNSHYFIFSDEPEWVNSNLDLGKASTVVNVNSSDRPEQDLRLMSSCKHFIIANSSFSWWGAWLSQYEDKTVIAPKQWFLDDRNTKDRCPPEWMRI